MPSPANPPPALAERRSHPSVSPSGPVERKLASLTWDSGILVARAAFCCRRLAGPGVGNRGHGRAPASRPLLLGVDSLLTVARLYCSLGF